MLKYSEEQKQQLRKRLEDFFEDESGFVIIFTSNDMKITDTYKLVCKRCVWKAIDKVLNDAETKGLLAKSSEHNEKHIHRKN